MQTKDYIRRFEQAGLAKAVSQSEIEAELSCRSDNVEYETINRVDFVWSRDVEMVGYPTNLAAQAAVSKPETSVVISIVSEIGQTWELEFNYLPDQCLASESSRHEKNAKVVAYLEGLETATKLTSLIDRKPIGCCFDLDLLSQDSIRLLFKNAKLKRVTCPEVEIRLAEIRKKKQEEREDLFYYEEDLYYDRYYRQFEDY